MDVLKVVGQSQVLDPPSQGARPERSRPESVAGPPSSGEEASEGAALDAAQVREVAEQLAARTGMQVKLVEDEKSGVNLLRILSPDGERVLRQFPPEAVVRLADRLRNSSGEGLLASLLVQ